MGYILNFQNNFNNMKNEIGRKITSLTLMTIMFAGGMTLAIPGFLPDSAIPIEAFADQGTTNGSLYLSSTEVQGAQVIHVIIDDPALNTAATNASVTIDVTPSQGSTVSVIMHQTTDGTYNAFLVDNVSAEAAEGITTGTDPINFGADCSLTFDTNNSPALDIDNVNVFADTTGCTDPDGSATTVNNVTASPGSQIAVGTAAMPGPAFLANVSGADTSSWPMVYGFDFADDNLVEYGSESIAFTWGQEASDISFTTNDDIVVPGQKIQLTLTDNGLNIDPTTVDAYTFLTTSGSETVNRSSVSTNSDLKSSLAALGFGDGGFMTISEDTTISSSAIASETTTDDSYIFTETGANTGVFTTHDAFGFSDASISTTCTVDDKVSYLYAGLTVTLVCATANASATFDAGATWSPGEAASYSVTDDDMNRNASYAETLNIHEDNIIPFVKIGEPKFLDASAMASVTAGSSGVTFAASDADGFATTVTATNTTDDSGRVSLALTAGSGDASALLTINTGWNASTWGDDTEPEEMLFYDICSIANNLRFNRNCSNLWWNCNS